MNRYDIIGDVHGFADSLEHLLNRLEYKKTADGWQHANRTAIFTGDLIDRGTENFKTLSIVKQMTENNAALIVMGNHEYNALCFHTPDPFHPGGFLRPHTEKNTGQHQTVLDEIKKGGQGAELLWQDYLLWFRQMPVSLELPGLRIVHACWDPQAIVLIELNQHKIRDHMGYLTDSFLFQSTQKNHQYFDAVEHLLKGIEIPLPPNHPGIRDRDNNVRKKVRLKWWLEPEQWEKVRFYHQAARIDEHLSEGLENLPVPFEILAPHKQRFKSLENIPTFFGHYWFTGTPEPLTPYAASVDYSIAKNGLLTCYRWDGEKTIDPTKFVSVNNSGR